jgi:hypothetical protein
VSRAAGFTVPTSKRSDPGHTTGEANYATKPRCGCGHPHAFHKDGRLSCSAATPKKCPCKHYEEA